MKRILLVGGGHTNALVLRRLAERPCQDAQVTLVSEGRLTPYSGMLTGFIAGSYSEKDLYIDLEKLARRAGARCIPDRASDLDREKSEIVLETGRRVGFDLAALDCGARPDLSPIPVGAEFVHPVKPIAKFQSDLTRFLDQSKHLGRPARFVQIGGGAAGCEIAAGILGRFQRMGCAVQMDLIEASKRLIEEAPIQVSKTFENLFHSYGARIHLGHKVQEVRTDRVILDDGSEIPSDFTSAALPPKPASEILSFPLEFTEEGFIKINSRLQTSDPRIFAVGDVAFNLQAPLPRAGVFAVRQAPVLFENLRAAIEGRELNAFHPQKTWLSLMIDGQGGALGYKGTWVIPRSRFAWRWKDWIDRRFMAQF